MAAAHNRVKILGVDFFQGSAAEAMRRVERGGLVVVPAAPALKDLATNLAYRQALLGADLVLADSGFMVLIWNRLQREKISRLSGLEYLRELLRHKAVRSAGSTFWIMPSEASAERGRSWLRRQGIEVPPDNVYVAPMYGPEIRDEVLLERLNQLRPSHIVASVGGGTQERLGLYLKRSLQYQPAIHCTGAAIAFLSGDQVHIPVWADKTYLGWLLRILSQPKLYGRRYWEARRLLALMLRYRDRLPDAIDPSATAEKT